MAHPGPTRILPKPKEAAAELKHRNAQLYAAIKPHELRSMAWDKKDASVKCPNILKAIDNWNTTQSAVRDDIVLADSPLKQKEMYKHYINLMDECSKGGDFHAANAIYMGLQCAAISRLQKALGDPSTQKILKNHDVLFEQGSNKANLRKAQEAKHKEGVVPLVALTLGGLLGADEIALPLSKALQVDTLIENTFSKLLPKKITQPKAVLGSWPQSSAVLTEEQNFQRSEQIKPKGIDTLQQPKVSAVDFMIQPQGEPKKAAKQPPVTPVVAPVVVKDAAVVAKEKEAKISGNVTELGFTKLAEEKDGGVKLDRKANNVYREILSTEESYQKGMDVLSLTNMVTVLKAFPAKPGKREMNKAEAQELLEKFEAVKNAEKGMSDALKKPEPKAWAQALSNMTKVYAEYGIVYDKLQIKEKKQFPETAKEAFKGIQQAADNSSIFSVEAILIQPIQRGPRFQMMFADLSKCTSADNPYHADMNALVEQTIKFAEKCNESIEVGKYTEPVVQQATQAQKLADVLEGFDAAADNAANKAQAKAAVVQPPQPKPPLTFSPSFSDKLKSKAPIESSPQAPKVASPVVQQAQQVNIGQDQALIEQAKIAKDVARVKRKAGPANDKPIESNRAFSDIRNKLHQERLEREAKRIGNAAKVDPSPTIPTREQEAKIEKDMARVERKAGPANDKPVESNRAFSDIRNKLHQERLEREAKRTGNATKVDPSPAIVHNLKRQEGNKDLRSLLVKPETTPEVTTKPKNTGKKI